MEEEFKKQRYVQPVAKRLSITKDLYAQALTPRNVQRILKVVEMIRPDAETASVPLCSHVEEAETVSA